jgi:hypothetical protein
MRGEPINVLLFVQEMIRGNHVNELRGEHTVERGRIFGVQPLVLEGDYSLLVFFRIMRACPGLRGRQASQKQPSHHDHFEPTIHALGLQVSKL